MALRTQAHDRGFSYVLQIEPDVVPIRSGWMEQAHSLMLTYEQLLAPDGACLRSPIWLSSPYLFFP